MRGKVLEQATSLTAPRITPAYAGKRLYGKISVMFILGSPPRMRGKVVRAGELGEAFGITPAYAGKSAVYKCRLCGEEGSPPRMRGKAEDGTTTKTYTGITPAYAGKSRTAGRQGARRGDHPRVCGEKRRSFAQFAGNRGSPPRMRGKEMQRSTNAG